MCIITAYKSETCPHRWMTITKFCGPNMGFSLTPLHEFAPASTKFFSGTPSFEIAAANTCPNCDKKGQYDGNVTRMVLKASGCRVTFGAGGMPNTMVGGVVGMPMNGYGYGPGYGHFSGYSSTGPAGALYQSPVPAQGLSPYQQQIEANRVAAEMRKRQFHPIQGQSESKCNIM